MLAYHPSSILAWDIWLMYRAMYSSNHERIHLYCTVRGHAGMQKMQTYIVYINYTQYIYKKKKNIYICIYKYIYFIFSKKQH